MKKPVPATPKNMVVRARSTGNLVFVCSSFHSSFFSEKVICLENKKAFEEYMESLLHEMKQ